MHSNSVRAASQRAYPKLKTSFVNSHNLNWSQLKQIAKSKLTVSLLKADSKPSWMSCSGISCAEKYIQKRNIGGTNADYSAVFEPTLHTVDKAHHKISFRFGKAITAIEWCVFFDG
jgi:hypothetical protein